MSASSVSARDLRGRRLGRYEVLAQLASGGMATVYVARAHGVAGFERLVAIKVLHPHLAHDEEFISMFLDEARLAARIRHPNVVPTLDISDTHGDGYFLVMEYIEGDHLAAILREAVRRKQSVPLPIALRILVDALEGLGAAHVLADADGAPLGIVHRDLSPHNILVGTDGIGRITDFGVAKAAVRLSSTRDGQFKGKLAYMAPEHASDGVADQRSDIFSMGIVLWETLTGRRLFRAENNGELLKRLLNEPIVAPSSIVPAAAPLDEICARALDRDPNARFQSCEAFIEALDRVLAEHVPGAPPRAVGRYVRELLGPKIDQQNETIKSAIAQLGRVSLSSGVTPLPDGQHLTRSGPMLRTPMPSSSSYSGSISAPRQWTFGADPVSETSRRNRTGRLRIVLATAGVVLLAIVIGLAVQSRPAPLAEEPRPAIALPPHEVSAPADPADLEPVNDQASSSTVLEATVAAPTMSARQLEVPDASPGMAAPRVSGRRSARRDTLRESTPSSHFGREEQEEDQMLKNPYRR